MKKDRKRLGLSRETLRHLTGRELRRANGGVETTVKCVEFSECQCASEGGCVTTSETCGSGTTMTSLVCGTWSFC